MTHDDIFQTAWDTLIDFVDSEALAAGIDSAETAQIYREIAAECRERANGLEDESEQETEND